jgi:hypothetical protein
MTLSLNLSPEAEEQLRDRAAHVGVSIQDLVADMVESVISHDGPPKNMADHLREIGVLGAIDGTPGPGDGRAWSEIEAACDPL